MLGGWGKPVAFAGEDVTHMGDVEGLKAGGEGAGLIEGDHLVVFAVEDEGWGKGGRGAGGVRLDETAGDFDDGAYAGVGSGIGEREEAPSEMPMRAMRVGSTLGRERM